MALTLSVGVAATASAQDQHSGGTPPPNGQNDPNARVLGETLRRGPAADPQAFGVSGSDLVGLAAIGLGAVAVGSTVVAGSRRRAARVAA